MPHSCICFHLPTSRTDHLCVRDCALALRYRVLIYHKSQLVEIISWCMADYEVSCYKFRRVGHTHTINAFIGGDVIATIAQLLWFAFDHSAKRQHNHPKRIVFKTTSIYLVMYLIICIYIFTCFGYVWHVTADASCGMMCVASWHFVDSRRSSWVSLRLWPLCETNKAAVNIVMETNTYLHFE